jgi:long-chain acyl-CoA synthetase
VARSLAYPEAPAWWLLERNVPRFGTRIAIRELESDGVGERRALTYEALWRAARGAATGLRARGVGAGSRIGLVLPNGAQLVMGYYASWLAGGVAVPANPRAHPHELEFQLADAGVSLVIAAAGSPARTAGERLHVPVIEADAFREMEALAPGPVPSCRPAEDPAVLLYTGGTTGTPKGATLTHRNLVANTLQFATWYAFEAGAETTIAVLPLFHSGGMSGAMNVPLSAGATLVVLERFRAPAVAEAVSRHRATRLFGVPTMFIALLGHPEARRADYGHLRACRTSAAPLPASVKAAFDALVGREVLVEGYGLTETSPLTHANPIHRPRAGSIGIPLPDTDARIVDVDSGLDVAPGVAGELLVRGPQVMRGYWNRPEETAAVLAGGWLRTGDVATMDAEGYFAIVDRKKDVINTGGFKVWPREVEEVLYAHPAVRLAAVVGAPDAYLGERVTAYVVPADGAGSPARAEELIAFCRARLTAYKVPTAVEFRAELPVSAVGKVLRRALRAPG